MQGSSDPLCLLSQFSIIDALGDPLHPESILLRGLGDEMDVGVHHLLVIIK
jgi:hypothetical protein